MKKIVLLTLGLMLLQITSPANAQELTLNNYEQVKILNQSPVTNNGWSLLYKQNYNLQEYTNDEGFSLSVGLESILSKYKKLNLLIKVEEYKNNRQVRKYKSCRNQVKVYTDTTLLSLTREYDKPGINSVFYTFSINNSQLNLLKSSKGLYIELCQDTYNITPVLDIINQIDTLNQEVQQK